MPQPRLIYSPNANMGLKGWQRLHPFDLRKYERAMGLLKGWECVPEKSVEQPRLTGDDDLAAVHPRAYLERLKDSHYVAAAVEVPQLGMLPRVVVERYLLRPMRWATGGTVLAARRAMEHGIAINLGGGFHHASRDKAEGFCIYCDIPLAIETLRAEGLAGTVLYIDLDAHQGNGVERVYIDDKSVAILDAYNAEIYPGDEFAKAAIRWDVPLPGGTRGPEYLERTRQHLDWALHEIKPVLAVYNAGTDIASGDPVGWLDVSFEHVLQRDRMVFDALTQRAIPWFMTTSGGYTDASHRLIAESVKYVFEKWA